MRRVDHALNLAFFVGLPAFGIAFGLGIATGSMEPLLSAALAVTGLLLGFVLLLRAKLSVLRRGVLLSVGPGPMDAPHRALYGWGYVLLVGSIALGLGTLAALAGGM